MYFWQLEHVSGISTTRTHCSNNAPLSPVIAKSKPMIGKFLYIDEGDINFTSRQVGETHHLVDRQKGIDMERF